MELNQPADQVIAVEAKFNLTSDQEIAMRELRKLRGDMWDRNVPFDGTTLRQAAAKHGLTSRDAYVNAAQYDAGLSRIALQRDAGQAGIVLGRVDVGVAGGQAVLGGGLAQRGAVERHVAVPHVPAQLAELTHGDFLVGGEVKLRLHGDDLVGRLVQLHPGDGRRVSGGGRGKRQGGGGRGCRGE